jgi:dipeptide transport system permease protein
VLSFIVRRLLALPLVMFAVSIIIVGLLQLLSPTQRAGSYIRSEAQARNIDVIVRQYGLDQPFPVQYGIWLREVLSGNLGFSRTSSEPVAETIRERLPASAELAIFAFIPIVWFGIAMGTAAALNRDKFVDQVSRVLAIVGWSLPTFVFGIWILVIFYGGYGLFGIGRVSNQYIEQIARGTIRTPTGFMTVDALLNGRFDLFWNALQHLVLPVTTLVVVICAQIMRVMRGSLIEALSQDYVRTARAKGLPERVVNLKHARRNALIPVVTLSGLVLAGLIAGTVVVETIFNFDGLGGWFARAAGQLDTPAVLGFALLVAFIITVANLVVDILYAFVDPRIRYD